MIPPQEDKCRERGLATECSGEIYVKERQKYGRDFKKEKVCKHVCADCWVGERLGTVSKDTLFRGQQLCKLTQLHQNDSWFQPQFFILKGAIHAVPFKAYKWGQRAEHYYPHTGKKKYIYIFKKEPVRDHVVSHDIAEGYMCCFSCMMTGIFGLCGLLVERF